MRLLGREPLTPPPPRGLIWGEGRRVLLLVRNNQSQPITFTARRSLTAGMHWTLRRRNSGALQIDGCKATDKKATGRNLWPPLHNTFHQQLCKSIAPPEMEVNNNLFRVCSSAPSPLSPLPPQSHSCPLSWPTRPLPVLFGHWRLSVGVYVQFTGAERSQFHVLLWNKTSLPLRSDEKWSGWAGWAPSGTVPRRRPAVRKSKRLLCHCSRLRVW